MVYDTAPYVPITALTQLNGDQLHEFFRELNDAYFTTMEYVDKPVCVICITELLLIDWCDRGEIKQGDWPKAARPFQRGLT